jgi:hypothetical protein
MALFVADTHSLAWYFTGSGKLGIKALQVFRDSSTTSLLDAKLLTRDEDIQKSGLVEAIW